MTDSRTTWNYDAISDKELAGFKIQLDILLAQNEGEITEEVEKLLDSIKINRNQKLTWLLEKKEEKLGVLKQKEELALKIKAQSIKIQKNVDFWEERINREMVDSVGGIQNIKNAKKTTVSGYEIYYTKGTTTVIKDKSAIPELYLKPQKPAPEREPDKTLIKAAINKGHAVPGAELEENHYLKIK